MTDTLTALLLRLSEGGRPALLWGRMAKAAFGPAFERLLADGVLVECPPAEEWSACADCECGFDARPIQRIGDRIIAACPFDASSDIELEEDDLRDFRIDPEKLVALIAEASGFPEPIETLAPDLWRIGRLASGRSVVVAVRARDARSSRDRAAAEGGGRRSAGDRAGARSRTCRFACAFSKRGSISSSCGRRSGPVHRGSIS